MGGKDGCTGRLEVATISDILYLFGQGNFIFIREKSGKSQGILKTHVSCLMLKFVLILMEVNLYPLVICYS